MAFTINRESDTVGQMQHPMRRYAKGDDGVLIRRSVGERARQDVERAIRDLAQGSPIALDFIGVRSVSVPFADALLVPLVSNRMTGYYEDHPLIVVHASEDVAETLGATLERRGLFILGVPPPRLLGGQATLGETLQIAQRISPFSVLDLARELDITQQAANNRVKLLLNSGALVRSRIVPLRGGREFVYEVPSLGARNGPRRAARSKAAKRVPIRD
jgi:hypothetical protein